MFRPPTARLLLSLLLSLLVVGMQAESQRHALEHLRPLLTRAHDVDVHAPVDDSACAECALLAGGADAAPGAALAAVAPAPATDAVVVASEGRPGEAPHYFQSRAPPVLL